MISPPAFFVVGAPKSGTTSVYAYLRGHPQVFLPRRKELLYYCTDLHFRFPLLNTEQFLSYYRNAHPNQVAGEVSVWNLFSVEAAQRIYTHNPRARIIAILRHPADMIHSLFQNHVFNRNEIFTDLEAALDAEPERRAGRLLSPVMRCPQEALYYSEVARYATQLRRYYAVFPAGQVLVLFFDDFARNTPQVFQKLLRFIGVDESYRPDFRIHNARKTVRSRWLRDVMTGGPAWLRRIVRMLLPHQSAARDWLEQRLWQINTQQTVATALSPVLRQRIIKMYEPEVRELSAMTGRDLTHWLEG